MAYVKDKNKDSYADQRKQKRYSGNTFIRSNPNVTKEDANFSDFSQNQKKHTESRVCGKCYKI